ncbi:MAG: response regulator [Tardiphaga sp.]|nr:response regulator [Tardiphaga sp.]
MIGRDLCVADPDARLRTSLVISFGHLGWSVRAVESGEALLTAVRDQPPSCVLIDIHAPTEQGLYTVSSLRSLGYTHPIVAMSSLGEAAVIVAAIQHGADDFIVKPCRPEALYQAVKRALDGWIEKQQGLDEALGARFVGHAMLTKRETDILRGIAAGATAREAAALLDISPRTVEFHRARILVKFGARNAADLMRIILRTAGHC